MSVECLVVPSVVTRPFDPSLRLPSPPPSAFQPCTPTAMRRHSVTPTTRPIRSSPLAGPVLSNNSIDSSRHDTAYSDDESDKTKLSPFRTSSSQEMSSPSSSTTHCRPSSDENDAVDSNSAEQVFTVQPSEPTVKQSRRASFSLLPKRKSTATPIDIPPTPPIPRWALQQIEPALVRDTKPDIEESGRSQSHSGKPATVSPKRPSQRRPQSLVKPLSRDPSQNWLSTNTYDITPPFSRLSLASPHVVLPVSAREYRRMSRPVSRASTISVASGSTRNDISPSTSLSPSPSSTMHGSSSSTTCGELTPSSHRSSFIGSLFSASPFPSPPPSPSSPYPSDTPSLRNSVRPRTKSDLSPKDRESSKTLPFDSIPAIRVSTPTSASIYTQAYAQTYDSSAKHHYTLNKDIDDTGDTDENENDTSYNPYVDDNSNDDNIYGPEVLFKKTSASLGHLSRRIRSMRRDKATLPKVNPPLPQVDLGTATTTTTMTTTTTTTMTTTTTTTQKGSEPLAAMGSLQVVAETRIKVAINLDPIPPLLPIDTSLGSLPHLADPMQAASLETATPPPAPPLPPLLLQGSSKKSSVVIRFLRTLSRLWT